MVKFSGKKQTNKQQHDIVTKKQNLYVHLSVFTWIAKYLVWQHLWQLVTPLLLSVHRVELMSKSDWL